MHIGIDARFYGPLAKGLGRYVQKLIEHLEKLDGENTYTVFLRQEAWDLYQPKNPRFQKVLADVAWYSLREQIDLPKILRSRKLDLMHFPHYNVPVLYRGPFVVTVHDLILSQYPTRRASTLGPLFYWIKHTAYNVVIRSAIRRAKAVLTVSEYSKQAIVDEFHIAPEKITVAYEAADPLPDVERDHQREAKIRSLQPYLLYVGNAYPHKNLEGLLSAFQSIKKRFQQPLNLVLVGKKDYFYERLEQLARSLHIQDSVRFAGGVSDAELAMLYRHAALYVFPSFIEGFGLPPLEAMRAGVPVVSSNRSCLPEVLGDAAVYVDPADTEALANAMLSVLADTNKQQELRKRGFQQVEQYRWDDLARTTLSVYTEKRR